VKCWDGVWQHIPKIAPPAERRWYHTKIECKVGQAVTCSAAPLVGVQMTGECF